MFNVGDKVKCVKVSPFPFTLDKIYEVVEYSSYGNDKEWNSIETDSGSMMIVNHFKFEGLFELVTKENKMSKVNYHLLTDSVIINHKAKTTIVRRGDTRFLDVVKCIKDGRLDDIPELLDTEAVFAKRGLELKDGLLHMEGEALPLALSDRVMRLVEEQMPIEVMVKFWANLKQNPSFNSRKMLYDFLTHNGHPLTEDGCFIAYRGVREDFKDKHTGKFDNSVGQVCEIPRNEVDDNPNNTCSHGLHVACYDYAKGFGEQLIEVKVNPKDVVAVPTDYNGTKMRVCKFEVMAVCEKIRTESVYNIEAETDDDLDYDDFSDEEDSEDYE